MISYRFVPISCQKGVLFFETPGAKKIFHSECNLVAFVTDIAVYFLILY